MYTTDILATKAPLSHPSMKGTWALSWIASLPRSDGSIPILDNSIIELLKPYLQISPQLFTKLNGWSYDIP